MSSFDNGVLVPTGYGYTQFNQPGVWGFTCPASPPGFRDNPHTNETPNPIDRNFDQPGNFNGGRPEAGAVELGTDRCGP